MKSRSTLYVIIGVLVLGLGVVSYLLYQEENKAGIEVEVDEDGLSVEAN